MALERLKQVPVFTHQIDEYELARMEPTDAYIARNNSILHQAIDWNNDQTVLINNAVVDQKDELNELKNEVNQIKEKLEDWETRFKILKTKIKSPLVIILGIITLFGPAFVSWALDHYLGKR